MKVMKTSDKDVRIITLQSSVKHIILSAEIYYNIL